MGLTCLVVSQLQCCELLALYRHFIDNARDHIRMRYVQSCDSLEKYDKFKALKTKRNKQENQTQNTYQHYGILNFDKERRNLRAERFCT